MDKRLSTREIAIFSMFGGLMYLSKIIMEWIPNVHLLATFIVVFTVVYRKKALIIIYVYVFVTGLNNGFAPWWYTNLYIWTVLWAMAMMVPQKLDKRIKVIVYMLICGLHGLAYGTLCAPMEALTYGFTLERTIRWIIVGLPFDIGHGISNFWSAIIILPLIKIVNKMEKRT